MFDEEKIILTFIYKRSGKAHLSPTEIYLPLSIELNWFTTKDAQHFLQHCLDHQLLKQTPNGLQPQFDIASIDIPTGFTPTKKIYTTEQNNNTSIPNTTIYQDIIQTISEKQKISTNDLEKKLTSYASTKNIHLITAAILYAKQHNIPLIYERKNIELFILQENEE